MVAKNWLIQEYVQEDSDKPIRGYCQVLERILTNPERKSDEFWRASWKFQWIRRKNLMNPKQDYNRTWSGFWQIRRSGFWRIHKFGRGFRRIQWRILIIRKGVQIHTGEDADECWRGFWRIRNRIQTTPRGCLSNLKEDSVNPVKNSVKPRKGIWWSHKSVLKIPDEDSEEFKGRFCRIRSRSLTAQEYDFDNSDESGENSDEPGESNKSGKDFDISEGGFRRNQELPNSGEDLDESMLRF